MRDKRRPWLDYKGSLELARQDRILREQKTQIMHLRNKYIALFLIFFGPLCALHRFYLYDSKIGWRIIKWSWCAYIVLAIFFMVLAPLRPTLSHINIIYIAILGMFIILELPYVFKTVNQINSEIAVND